MNGGRAVIKESALFPRRIARDSEMTMTNNEFNVLRVMAEKDIAWTWMMLDRTLALRGIAGFGNVANIVTRLVSMEMVETVYDESTSKPRYRVSEQGHQLLRKPHDD